MSNRVSIIDSLPRGEQPLNGESMLAEEGRGRLKAAFVALALSVSLAACSSGGAEVEHAPPTSGHVLPQPRHAPPVSECGQELFCDSFDYPGGNMRPVVITGEGSYFSPGSDCPTSDRYVMTSGTLIAYKGEAITGDPTTETGDVPCDSTTRNDNNVFRLLTKKSFGPDISVSLDYTPLADTGPKSQHDSFDGFTLLIGNQPNSKNEDYGLYTVSIRNGGEVVIKKKVPASELSSAEIAKLKQTGDFANGGGYYALSKYLERPDLATMGKQRHVVANLQKLPNGEVKITITVDGEAVVSAVDTGVHGAPYSSGQVGVRLDYTKAGFDNLKVAKLPAGSPETLSAWRRPSRLGELSIGGYSIPPISARAGNPFWLPGSNQEPLAPTA